MKTDSQLREEVIDQLALESGVDDREIGVAVKFGVVTLSGAVTSYIQQAAAEQAVRKVLGVKAMVEDIKVVRGKELKKCGHEIAQAAICALVQNVSVPHDKIFIEVKGGIIYLSGHVQWEYQRVAAQMCLQHIAGVERVINGILLNPKKTANMQTGANQAPERLMP
jgi:osmotically-inducible protein OsmY